MYFLIEVAETENEATYYVGTQSFPYLLPELEHNDGTLREFESKEQAMPQFPEEEYEQHAGLPMARHIG